jgi:hypothetical protein
MQLSLAAGINAFAADPWTAFAKIDLPATPR